MIPYLMVMFKTCGSKSNRIYFIALILFFIGCSSPQKVPNEVILSPDEYEWVECFFEDLMLEESGIFTLWGSKPLTFFEINYPSDEKKGKLQKWLRGLSEKEKKNVVLWIEEKDKGADWFKELPKETQEKAIFRTPKKFPFYLCWEKWKKIKDHFAMPKYLLVEKPGIVYPNKRYLFFVNISETFFILEENYDRFVRKVGKDFDPLRVIFELENEASIFWKRVLQDAELIGLLCGFGKKNAWCFSLKEDDYSPLVKPFLNTLFHIHPKQHPCGKAATINDFPIPGFRSFVKNDEMVARYEEKKEIIKRTYKNKDFVYQTLLKLAED